MNTNPVPDETYKIHPHIAELETALIEWSEKYSELQATLNNVVNDLNQAKTNIDAMAIINQKQTQRIAYLENLLQELTQDKKP